MAVEDVIVASAQPYLINTRINRLMRREFFKGCSAQVFDFPVLLEPSYCPVSAWLEEHQEDLPQRAVESTPQRLRVWISPEQDFDWIRAERFLKQLAGLRCRAGFEIRGNRERIEVTLLCHPNDAAFLHTAFVGEFEHSRLTPFESGFLISQGAERVLHMRDFYPVGPYSRLLTGFEELRHSPFETLLCSFAGIPPPWWGFYQCLFEPVAHDWHRNVETLQDLEYTAKLQQNPWSHNSFVQQVPSGDLRGSALELDVKAHNDKPFFAVAVRMGVVGAESPNSDVLYPMTAFIHLYQHGGRGLSSVTEADYRNSISDSDLFRAIHLAQTFRPGFLLNSKELAGLVHLFPASIVGGRRLPLEILKTLPLRNPDMGCGTIIGISRHAGVESPVRISPPIRECGTHLVAGTGMGKSTVLTNMFLQDIAEGHGATFIDAHGDSVRQLMAMIPKEHLPRCIYFDCGNPHWIPCWNPLHIPPGGNIYRLSDDLLSAFERVSRDWGDRLAHVLRNGLIGLAGLEDATMLDLYHLVRQKSPESEALRKRIVVTARDDPVKKFWERDFLKDYRETDLSSPKHKLHKLMAGGSISLMLSQPDSKIHFREIMDEGKILLMDLSTVGSDSREILGGFSLNLLMMAAISRSDLSHDQRRPFSMFVDEAHLFVSADAIENLIAQARKFRVRLTIAHQYLRQFKTAQIDALSTVGTSIIGRLDKRDSQYFAKDLQDMVEPSEILKLEPFEMIARIGTEIVRVHTLRSPEPKETGQVAAIIEQSRKEYYREAASIRARISRQAAAVSEISEACEFTPEQLTYDEF